MSTFLEKAKLDCSRWAIGWAIVGAVGLALLTLQVLVFQWPLSVEMILAMVWGWMIGMGISQPVVALIQWRTDVNFDQRMRSLYR